jgi:polyribonucleotide nucleotidyltransferase
MADAITVSGAISGTDKSLSFETGKLAPQSQGAVVVKLGDTAVLVTANGEKSTREGIDFFPLTVDIEERAYAAGKIPGSFFRREARPPDTAVLTCRLIDRPLRPSFAEGYRNETQIVGTVLGADFVNPYDVPAINGASAALMLSGLPFEGPIGAVRLAFSQEGTWIPHPTYEEGDESTFEIVVAGRAAGDDIAIMMVEAGGTEKAYDYYDAGAPFVTEDVVADGLEQAKTWIRESIELQLELVKQAGTREPMPFESGTDYGDDVFAAVEKAGRDSLSQAHQIVDKTERNAADKAAVTAIVESLGDQFEGREREVKNAIKSLTKKIIRQRVVNEGVRIDGRGVADLRPVTAEVGLMPRMDQMLDTLSPDERKRFMHHYNMPPYSNGETGRVGGTKRREVGHGLLAERALLPVVPSQEKFSYAIRLVSEVLSSNGSTSMGSVCSGSLSLMDAGVPTRGHVSGIAMGLIYEDGKYTTLTDILGAEDAYGDMDFKVAGTQEAITALQLDTKIEGLPADVLKAALLQARDARLQILEVMNATIAEPRAEVAASAPKIISFEIPIDKIGEVIGPKGKVINTLQQETGADIAVDDDGMVGTVTIGSKDGEAVAEARRRIELIMDPPSAEVGKTYQGRVVNITKFGAFVNILPGRDGLLHISKLGEGKRVNAVEDVLSLGDAVEVVVEDIDPQGKVSLSPVGYEAPPKEDRPRRERSDRDRGDRPERGDRDRGERAPREERSAEGGVAVVSFEDAFDAELKEEFGDLGPASAEPPADRGDRPRGGGRPRGGRR